MPEFPGIGVDNDLRVDFFGPQDDTIKTCDSALPANHILEQPDRRLEVKSAARRTGLVRVIPRERTLKLIDGGSLD